MSHKKELLSRAYIVLGGLSLFALLLLGGTMKIGVIDADVWRERGDSSKLKFIDIEPDRGKYPVRRWSPSCHVRAAF